MADEQQAPKAEAALPNVPSAWPGAFGAYKYSKQVVMRNIWTLVVLWLIAAIVGGGAERVLGTGGSLFSSLLSVLLTVSYTLVYLAGVRGQEMSIGDSISKAVPFWLKMIGLGIVVSVTLVISLLLLVIPFFFVLPRVSLSHYFLIDKNMGIMESFKASWAATEGNAGKVWGIIGANIAMALLMITIIGIPFSIYFLLMYSGAYVVLYELLNKGKPATAAPATTEAPAAPAAA